MKKVWLNAMKYWIKGKIMSLFLAHIDIPLKSETSETRKCWAGTLLCSVKFSSCRLTCIFKYKYIKV